MSILNELDNQAQWQAFYAYKCEKSHLSKADETFLRQFIENEGYKPVVESMLKGQNFSIPAKRYLNKHGKSKKRVVYTYTEQENTVLKLVAFLLYRYDDAQPPNCYSFRRHYGAKKAIHTLMQVTGIAAKYTCKLDIKDYFNSIDVELLLPILREVLWDDEPLYAFFDKLLAADQAVCDGITIAEKRGAMAGIPISQFFANIYLAEIDRYFMDAGVLYARYSDDIIFFADTGEQLAEYLIVVETFLAKYHLEVNPEKVRMTAPYEKWDYLGIAFDNGQIGLSDATLKKIKGKIRRKARSIYRWKNRKGAADAHVMRVFARSMNRKFFGKDENDEFTWARWFFPLITTDHDLKAIDAYMQEHIRYLSSGHFTKANYKIRYSDLKACGYRSLVNEYYRFKQGQPFHIE